MPTSTLTDIRFASFLTCAPQSKGSTYVRSCRLRGGIQNDSGGLIALAVQRLALLWPLPEFEGVLGPDVVLVPAPRSAPLVRDDALWPALRVAEELRSRGLAAEVLPVLVRDVPAPRAMHALGAAGPSYYDHLETIEFRGDDKRPPARVVVVDDFAFSGGTLLASASHIKAAWPSSEVKAFALVRLVLDDVLLPCLEMPAKGCIKFHELLERTALYA